MNTQSSLTKEFIYVISKLTQNELKTFYHLIKEIEINNVLQQTK